METIKLLRLKNGEDIIAYLEQVDKMNFILREPMEVMVKFDNRTGKQTVLMDYWLPKTLIRQNEAFITEADILTIMDPTSEFSNYFETTVGSINIDSIDDDVVTETGVKLNQRLMDVILDTVGPDISVVH